MSQARFESAGATPLVFGVNPAYPGRVVLRTSSVRAETEGGAEYVYRKGGGYLQLTLRFDGLPASDFDGGFDYAAGTQAEGSQSLVNWFFGVTGMGASSFTYYDPFGNTREVAFMDDRLEFAMTDHGQYTGIINLKERLGKANEDV
jgi:hypothetical protein